MIAFETVFRRHPGVYDVMHTTERPGKKEGHIEQVRVATHARITARQVETLVRREVEADPFATLTIFAASRGDNGCIGWIHQRNIDEMFKEVPDDGMELPAERGAAALLPRRAEPVREVDDSGDDSVPEGAIPVDRPVRRVPPEGVPQQRTPRKAGAALALGAGEWPKKSEPARLVREWFEAEPDRRATTAEMIEALGTQLTALGVQFPASLFSRLKQAGLLVPAPEAAE